MRHPALLKAWRGGGGGQTKGKHSKISRKIIWDLLIVSGSYQNYQHGAVGNQLLVVGRGRGEGGVCSVHSVGA